VSPLLLLLVTFTYVVWLTLLLRLDTRTVTLRTVTRLTSSGVGWLPLVLRFVPLRYGPPTVTVTVIVTLTYVIWAIVCYCYRCYYHVVVGLLFVTTFIGLFGYGCHSYTLRLVVVGPHFARLLRCYIWFTVVTTPRLRWLQLTGWLRWLFGLRFVTFTGTFGYRLLAVRIYGCLHTYGAVGWLYTHWLLWFTFTVG